MVSISISIAALLVSVLSPFLTALLKNRHEIKMYKLRFYSEHKADTIEQYVKAAGEMVQSPSSENCRIFGSAHGKLVLYVSDPVRSTMQELYDMFVASKHVSDRSRAPELFDSICLMLAEQYPRIKP